MTNDERFDRIDAAIERMGERLTKYILDLRGETTQRLDRIDHRLDGLSATIASLDARLPPLTKLVLDADVFTAQQAAQQRELADRVKKLEETVANLIKPAA